MKHGDGDVPSFSLCLPEGIPKAGFQQDGATKGASEGQV